MTQINDILDDLDSLSRVALNEKQVNMIERLRQVLRSTKMSASAMVDGIHGVVISEPCLSFYHKQGLTRRQISDKIGQHARARFLCACEVGAQPPCQCDEGLLLNNRRRDEEGDQ